MILSFFTLLIGLNGVQVRQPLGDEFIYTLDGWSTVSVRRNNADTLLFHAVFLQGQTQRLFTANENRFYISLNNYLTIPNITLADEVSYLTLWVLILEQGAHIRPESPLQPITDRICEIMSFFDWLEMTPGQICVPCS